MLIDFFNQYWFLSILLFLGITGLTKSLIYRCNFTGANKWPGLNLFDKIMLGIIGVISIMLFLLYLFNYTPDENRIKKNYGTKKHAEYIEDMKKNGR